MFLTRFVIGSEALEDAFDESGAVAVAACSETDDDAALPALAVSSKSMLAIDSGVIPRQ